MRRRDFLRYAGAGSMGMAWQALAGAGETKPGARPNILWLSAEDISPLLGCYGDGFARTPHLDRLAGEGVRYERAYSHAPVCSPSRSSIITGVSPATLGTHQHRSLATLPEGIRCFTEYLREAGYYCSNNNKKDYNFKDAPGAWDVSGDEAHWRGRQPGQPFFSVFNHGVSHESLLHKPEAEFDALCAAWHVERCDPGKVPIPAYHPDIPEFRADWARYYDAVAVLDAQIAERLKELEEDGLAESTVVFFWGDHGTGITRGKRWVYESGTRVPLIARFPKAYAYLAPGKPGTVESRLVSLMDLGPSMLSLAGIPIPAYMQGQAFLGAGEQPRREWVYFVRDRMDEALDFIRAVRGKRYRYIRNFYPHVHYDQYNAYLFKERSARAWRRMGDGCTGAAALYLRAMKPMEELFDTEADPEEVRNLASEPAHQGVLVEMRERLCAWMLETRDLGLLEEAELYRRAGDRPAMRLGTEPGAFDVARILETANLPLQGNGAVGELMKRLKDGDSGVRYWAAVGLTALGGPDEAAGELEGALGDGCPSVRAAAAFALCRMGRVEKALPVFAEDLKRGDKHLRRRILNSLGLLGARALPLAKDVEALLTDRDADVQRAAATALVEIGIRDGGIWKSGNQEGKGLIGNLEIRKS